MENVFFLLLCVIPIFAFAGFFILIRNRISKKSRLPFDITKSLRVPGYSILVDLKSHQVDIGAYLGLSVFIAIIPFAQAGIYTLFDKPIKFLPSVIILMLIGEALLFRKAILSFKIIQNQRLGLEAEWAVAGELSQIKEPGVTVFHDVQCDNFNIDHVVTSPHGILAIETKGRRKPNNPNNQQTFKVELKGDKLIFPHYIDTSIVKQALRQAKWLKQLLDSSTGDAFNVVPAVVIPGWFVEMKSKPEILAWPLKKLRENYRHGMKQSLDPQQLKRVNHQLAILCQRDSDEF